MKFRVLVLSVAITAALAVTAVAAGSPSTPSNGPWWGETKPPGGNDSAARFVVAGAKIKPYAFSRKLKAIVPPTNFACNVAILQLPVKQIKIKKSGRFSYKGKVVDKYGTEPSGIRGDLTWKGKFTSAAKVKGTLRLKTKVTPVWHEDTYEYEFKRKPCDTGKVKWSGVPES